MRARMAWWAWWVEQERGGPGAMESEEAEEVKESRQGAGGGSWPAQEDGTFSSKFFSESSGLTSFWNALRSWTMLTRTLGSARSSFSSSRRSTTVFGGGGGLPLDSATHERMKWIWSSCPPVAACIASIELPNFSTIAFAFTLLGGSAAVGFSLILFLPGSITCPGGLSASAGESSRSIHILKTPLCSDSSPRPLPCHVLSARGFKGGPC